MTTYYEKRLATEFPKESGSYPTDKGVLDYNAENKSWSSTKGLNRTLTISEHPEWWLYPIPSTIPSMTLEEARQKNRIVNKDKYKSLLKETMSPEAVSIVVENDFAELYLQHNTLSLKQEVEGLKESCVRLHDELFEMRENPNYADARVKILQEENERLLSLLNQK